MFEAEQVLPGIYHIKDIMGVCMTLITGKDRALLVDTGYGIEDVRGFVRTLTDLPLTVLLTHGHHDHALGAVWFDEVVLFEEEKPVYERYGGSAQRERVAGQAAAKGIRVPDDFLTKPMAAARYAHGDAGESGFDEIVMDLGGVTARIMKVPGHTPGSAVILVPERELLLTADDWNPCTWVWFPEACGIKAWRTNMERVFEKVSFEHVLCSHQARLYSHDDPVRFVRFMTDDVLKNAPYAEMGSATDTRRVMPDETTQLVFDRAKMTE